MAQIEDLLNQASEIRNADQEKENTAQRVGKMLMDIIQHIAGFVSVEGLQAVLADYAPLQGALVHWRNSRVVCLASMGSELDNIDGGDWQYTNHAGDIVFNPSGRNLSIVGEQGNYSVFPGVFYVNLHSRHCYVWDATTQAMIEITDSSRPTIIDYRNNPLFAQVAIGESYYFESGSAKKIAIKTSSSGSYSFDPDPKKIYVFKDTCESMIWNATTRSWIAIGKNIEIVDNLTEGGRNKSLSAEMGKELARMISNAGSSRVLEQRVAIIAEILQNAVFTSDQSQRFEDLAALEDAVDSITLNVSSHTFNGIGGTFTLVATTVPSGKSVRWESSNPAVATVDSNGVVTPVSYGPCVITAKAGSNNVAATCSITVQQFQVDSVSIDQSDILLDNVTEGYTKQLTATTMYNGQVVQAGVTWSSSNPGVATIDANTGLVTVIGNGQTTITATSGTESDTITIRVSGVVHEFHISLGTLTNVTIEDGDGNAITNGQAVLENSSLTIKLIPAANHQITAASVMMGNVAQTLTDNQDGSKSVALTVSGDITISASAEFHAVNLANSSNFLQNQGVRSEGVINNTDSIDCYKIPLNAGRRYIIFGYGIANGGTANRIALGTMENGAFRGLTASDFKSNSSYYTQNCLWTSGNCWSVVNATISNGLIDVKTPLVSDLRDQTMQLYLGINTAWRGSNAFDVSDTIEIYECPFEIGNYNRLNSLWALGTRSSKALEMDTNIISAVVKLDKGATYDFGGFVRSVGSGQSLAYCDFSILKTSNRGMTFDKLTSNDIPGSYTSSFFTVDTNGVIAQNVGESGTFTVPSSDALASGVGDLYLFAKMKYGTLLLIDDTNLVIEKR